MNHHAFALRSYVGPRSGTEFTEALDLRMTVRRRSCEPLPHDSSDFSPSFQGKQSRIGRRSGEKFGLLTNNASELNRLPGMVTCCPKGWRGVARSPSPDRATRDLLSVLSVYQWLAIFGFLPLPIWELELGTSWVFEGLESEPIRPPAH